MDKMFEYWKGEMLFQIESLVNEEENEKLKAICEDEEKLNAFTDQCVRKMFDYGEFWVDITNWLEDVINEELKEEK